jgi:hypothetical protein
MKRMSVFMSSGVTTYARLLIEEKLDRLLTSDEIVHHIDGDLQNDELSNLQVMTNAEHTRLHHLGRKKGPFTDEHKRRLSLARQGKSSGMKGRHHSEETKEKMKISRAFFAKLRKGEILI